MDRQVDRVDREINRSIDRYIYEELFPFFLFLEAPKSLNPDTFVGLTTYAF